MSNTVIIIPSRLKAERLPNKPLKLIRNKEMILHVYDLAVKSKVGEVLLVTPDNEIAELIKKMVVIHSYQKAIMKREQTEFL